MARLRRRWRILKWAGLVMPWRAKYRSFVLFCISCLIASAIACGWMLRRSDVPHHVLHIAFLFFLLFAMLLLSLVCAGMKYRDRRRIPPHCCQRCGYNLTGNVSGICPECGSPCYP